MPPILASLWDTVRERAHTAKDDLVVVDLFCGGGGTSEGVRNATGRSPLLAVNHNPAAIEMHTLNHPDTIHYCKDVWSVPPAEACRGILVDLLWASVDCRHFSRARGGKPKDRGIRDLAWVIIKWAKAVKPPVVCLENVPEFCGWGPLDANNKVVKARRGETFQKWIGQLEALDYEVEWRVLTACDYGTPTSRKRLFVVARRDGLPIVWPEPTHGPGRDLPYRTAGECIDWSLPMLSVFATPKEAKAWARKVKADGTPKRPLADNTMARIAEGLRRYVLNTGDPYIVRIGQTGGGGSYTYSPDDPLTTIVSKAEHLLVGASLINTRNGERKGQTPRTRSLGEPAPTITAQGSQGALIAANLAQHNRGAVGRDLGKPMSTVAGAINKSLVAAHLEKFYGQGGQWSGADEPMHTLVGKARMALVQAHFGSSKDHSDKVRALVGQEPVVNIDGVRYRVMDVSMRMLQPEELKLAQGFSPETILTGNKGEQVERVGQSVPPQLAEVLVRAQFPDRVLAASA
jgi:DNA (cytosine-5)-methyltransferase 1